MDKKEKLQILQIIERLTKLETKISLEFEHLREELKEINQHVRKLNEEYGAISSEVQDLKTRQDVLETKYGTQIKMWKFIAGLVSPFLTYLILELLKVIFQ